MQRGVIPYISHLADTLPVACGVAMVLKRRRESKVVLVHFGEGTTSRGDTHEAMNLAGVMKLPVLFICNNNGYAYSTPTSKQYAVENISVRGPAYGMPGVTIDGNDVLAVHSTVAKAIARARRGDGPSLIECKTFRMTGHSAHDAAEYVPQEVKKKEPGKIRFCVSKRCSSNRELSSETAFRKWNARFRGKSIGLSKRPTQFHCLKRPALSKVFTATPIVGGKSRSRLPGRKLRDRKFRATINGA